MDFGCLKFVGFWYEINNGRLSDEDIILLHVRINPGHGKGMHLHSQALRPYQVCHLVHCTERTAASMPCLLLQISCLPCDAFADETLKPVTQPWQECILARDQQPLSGEWDMVLSQCYNPILRIKCGCILDIHGLLNCSCTDRCALRVCVFTRAPRHAMLSQNSGFFSSFCTWSFESMPDTQICCARVIAGAWLFPSARSTTAEW